MPLKDILPVPSLATARCVLCVQPHPDDNEIAAGGTIALLAERGARVVYLTVTDGSVGTRDPSITPERLAAMRREEATRSARHLGASDTLWLGCRDGAIPDEVELSRRILGVIRQVRPDAVLAPDPWLTYEAHRDHRGVGLATASAAMMSEFPHATSDPDGPPHAVSVVAFYCTLSPNTWIDVDRTWARKIEALMMHASQFGAGSGMFLMYLDMKARELAKSKGCVRAEAFKVLPTMLLHFNVDAASF